MGIAGEKAQNGGASRDGRGGGGLVVGSVRVGRGGAPPAAGNGGLLFGQLRGVEVEDEPQALDFVSNGCKID